MRANCLERAQWLSGWPYSVVRTFLAHYETNLLDNTLYPLVIAIAPPDPAQDTLCKVLETNRSQTPRPSQFVKGTHVRVWTWPITRRRARGLPQIDGPTEV